LSSAQLFRVTTAFGKVLKNEVVNERVLSPLSKEEVLYVEADGSMLLTREEQWKEVKVGRIFKSSDCMDVNETRGWISNSQYLAHLGNCEEFTKQMDALIDSFGDLKCRLLFLSDGATWLRNWISDSFPNAISILDYYHAIEHLHLFSRSYFSDPSKENKWTDKQKELLLESKVTVVIKNIETLLKICPNEEGDKLINYYWSNKDRMDYKKYLSIGCGIIGSGAIESSHRTLIQKRMKLSGQRWSMDGAKSMLKIRVVNKNHQWNKIIELAKHGFKKVA
jgi:hypothetical protein